jgi:hypothetical protein
MGYADNPFNSPQGQELVKQIFNLMFIEPEGKPSKIEVRDKARQVNHYRGNIVNIVNKMRKFVKGYEQVLISEANSSGIHICPHCRRRDAIWMWETVDAGHYSSPAEWLSSVTLTRWNTGNADEKGRYQFVVRYRCNDVTTCEKCHISVAGHYSTCKDCGSSKVSQVGCGEESYATHFIREYTADDNHPQEQGEQTGAIDRNREIRVRRDFYAGQVSGYKYHHTQVPDGEVVKEWSDIKRHLPMVTFQYTHVLTGKTKTENYPVSELNYAVSKQSLVQCVMGKVTGGGVNAHAGSIIKLESYGEPLDACPQRNCRATDYPPLQEVPNLYYQPRPMKIMNSQPLSADTATGGTYKRQPVFTLYLESPVTDAYKLILPLPQVMTLNPIPNEAQISTLTKAKNTCPNDVGAGVEEEEAIKEANEELQKKQKEMVQQAMTLSADATEADAQTNTGFTFDVCEGRSHTAYYDFSISKWIDDSPPCKSFRKDGTTLTKSREYPRWSEIPSYSPHAKPDTFFNEYLGPNPSTHFICDWMKANQILAAFAAMPPIYHTVDKIGERIDEDLGLIFEVFECDTCKGIVEEGGIIPFRQSMGQCDENGQSINDFPQIVLDTEIEFENSYPLVNSKGEAVPTAWGIDASSDHEGKKMLLNPDLNIRIA